MIRCTMASDHPVSSEVLIREVCPHDLHKVHSLDDPMVYTTDHRWSLEELVREVCPHGFLRLHSPDDPV